MEHTTADLSSRRSSVEGPPSPAASAPLVAEQVSKDAAAAGDAIVASSSCLPALPVEVIERIFKCTFLPTAPLTPSSDPHHLRGTTHVLRVSRAIRHLALPFVYYTVVITRPSDDVTFFDPEHGLLVAGEDGKRRWSLVREIGIVAGVWPELAPAVHDGNDFLMPLEIPANGNIKVACFLYAAIDEAWPTTADRDEIIGFVDRSPALADADFATDYDLSDSQDYSFFLDDVVQEALKQRLALVIHLITQRSFCEMRLSLPTARALYSVEFRLNPIRGPDHLICLYYPPQNALGPFNAAGLAFILRRIRERLGKAEVVRLQGWPKELLEMVSKGFETAAAAVGIVREGGELLQWVWTWRAQDGSDVLLVPPSMASNSAWRDNLARVDAALIDDEA